MKDNITTQLNTLIRQSQECVTNTALVAHDYHSLSTLVIEKDLENECKKLLTLISNDTSMEDIKAGFKILCASREKQNIDGRLTFNHSMIYVRAIVLKLPPMNSMP